MSRPKGTPSERLKRYFHMEVDGIAHWSHIKHKCTYILSIEEMARVNEKRGAVIYYKEMVGRAMRKVCGVEWNERQG